MISTYFQSLIGKMKAVFKRYTSSKVHYCFEFRKTVSKTNETSLGMTFHWLWDNFAWRFFILDTETPWHIKLFPGILEQNILKTHMTLKTSKHWSFTQTYLWLNRKHHFMLKSKTASTLLWLRWCIILCTYQFSTAKFV